MSILDDNVLLLNKNMQPLRIIKVRRAFYLLTKPRKKVPSDKVATALYVDENHEIIGPVKYEEWLTLPCVPGDRVIHTGKATIKVPSIIILSEFDRIPLQNRKLSKSALWQKQEGKDAYTLEDLEWDNCDIDHVHARSKGGPKTWDNCALTSIPNNRKKDNKTLAEAGFKLMIPLGAPKPKPGFLRIERDARFPEWNYFIRH